MSASIRELCARYVQLQQQETELRRKGRASESEAAWERGSLLERRGRHDRQESSKVTVGKRGRMTRAMDAAEPSSMSPR